MATGDTTKRGRVVETAGRRVVVRDENGDRLCFLGGHRAVVGDRVEWTEARGEGGKITSVERRETALRRIDPRGGEQILAANLGGILVVASASEPPFSPPVVDGYLVAASEGGLDAAIVLTKVDLGVPAEVEEAISARAVVDVPVLRVASPSGVGLDVLRAFIAEKALRPWALVGHSGVGKTSLIAALLPGIDVGPIGEISEFWQAGRHTTTRTRLFSLPSGGELADSPGIRGFLPAISDPVALRDHFPGVSGLACRYRDCLHRTGEDGCVADASVHPSLLRSYRRLMSDADAIRKRSSA